MAVFQYQADETPIHRLHPALKVAFMAMIVLLIVIGIATVAKLPFGEYRGLLVVVVLMMFVASGYHAIFLVNPGFFKVYPAELVARVLLRLTPKGFPLLGETALTVGSLVWLARLPLQSLSTVLLLATFLHTTSLNDMVQVMSFLHAPFPAIYIAMVASRFTPDLSRQIYVIQTAQKLRGWSPETRNPIKKIRAFAPLLMPLARYTIKCIDVMTISVQNRAFGSGPVTGMRSLAMRRVEKAALVIAFLVFVGLLYGIFGLNWGNL